MSQVSGYDMEVVSVDPKSHEIVFRVFNTRFRWIQTGFGEGLRMVSRWKPGSEGRSAAALWVPKFIWNKMREMVGGIAAERFNWVSEFTAPPEPEDPLAGSEEQFEFQFDQGPEKTKISRKESCRRRSGKAKKAPVPKKGLFAGFPTRDSKSPSFHELRSFINGTRVA